MKIAGSHSEVIKEHPTLRSRTLTGAIVKLTAAKEKDHDGWMKLWEQGRRRDQEVRRQLDDSSSLRGRK